MRGERQREERRETEGVEEEDRDREMRGERQREGRDKAMRQNERCCVVT